MILNLVRMKGKSLRPIRFPRANSALFAIPITVMLTAAMLLLGTTNANANVLGSASDTSTFGGSTGGSVTHRASCATNSVVVGISTNGTSGVSVWCRALQSDGTLPLNDNTSSNSTKVNVWGSTPTNVCCPAGTAATSLRIRVNGYPTGSGLN